MKAKPYKQTETGQIECEADEATHILIALPGPIMHRMMPVIRRGSRRDHDGAVWTWNGCIEKPTLKPSISTKGTRPITDEEGERILAGEKLNLPEIHCHTWITEGVAYFLPDCTHELAGQNLPLLEVD